MKTAFLFVVLSLSFVHLAQNAGDCNSKLYGNWSNNDYGYNMTLEFKENGKCVLDGTEMSFSCSGSVLFVVAEGIQSSYTYSADDKSLSLNGQAGEGALILQRSGTISVNSSANISNSNQGTTTVNSSQSTNNQLIGLWSGNNETIEFLANNNCNYTGQTFKYETTSTEITLKTGMGDVKFAYVIKGNELTLLVNGNRLIYTKGEAIANQSQNNASGKGKVATELVGKWCWTNVTSTNSGGSTSEKCIVLNADGTYTYSASRSMDNNTDTFYAGTSSESSDRGTWTFDGQRIHYNSQMGKGSGSYKLEKRNHPRNGDPMIVLDGETYVTYYQKSSW
jgi:hypothetical protein